MYAFKGFFIEPQILNLVEKILVLIFFFFNPTFALLRIVGPVELLASPA